MLGRGISSTPSPQRRLSNFLDMPWPGALKGATAKKGYIHSLKDQ